MRCFAARRLPDPSAPGWRPPRRPPLVPGAARAAAVALWLLSATVTAAQERAQTERCVSRCTLYVTSERERARRCQLCFTAEDEGAWLLGLPKVPPGAMVDPDWQVRWAAVRLDAKLAKVPAQRRLANWVSNSAGEERALACLTALHVAGAARVTLAVQLAAKTTGDPAAAGACAALGTTLVRALEPDLFEASATARAEALEHLAFGLGESPARLLLDAVRTRPAAFDAVAAEGLVEACRRREVAAGRALLDVATADDTPQVNRLLAVFSATRDRARPQLSAGAMLERLEAVHALGPLSPLSDPELTTALLDSSTQVRAAAAAWLARGEHHTVAEATEARLAGTVTASVDERVRWLALLGDLSAEGCAAVAHMGWADATQPDLVRGAALEAWATCDRTGAEPSVRLAAGSGQPGDQAAALLAVVHWPRGPFAVDLISRGLGAEPVGVLVAALRAAGAHRLTQASTRVERLATHPSPQVRSEALLALATLSPSLGRLKAASALAEDGEEDVRVAAATALGELGGPQALQALTAALGDGSTRVKFVAGESLRRLGNGSVQP